MRNLKPTNSLKNIFERKKRIVIWYLNLSSLYVFFNRWDLVSRVKVFSSIQIKKKSYKMILKNIVNLKTTQQALELYKNILKT